MSKLKFLSILRGKILDLLGAFEAPKFAKSYSFDAFEGQNFILGQNQTKKKGQNSKIGKHLRG